MNVAVEKVTKNLSLFIGLKLLEGPEVEIDENSTPRQSVTNLVRAGLMPHHSEVPEEIAALVRKAEEEGRSKVKGCVFDLLGVYLPSDNRVVLFDKLIGECARRLGFGIVDLRNVVLRHELAHQVTHRGLDSSGKGWEHFCAASAKSREYFAQLYAYKFARRERWGKGTRIMAILSKHESSIYRSYQKSIRLSMDSIHSRLMEERAKQPEIAIVPPLRVIPDPEPSDLGKIQARIEPIEQAMMQYRTENHDNGTNIEIAEKLGLRDRYERLLKRRDMATWAEDESIRSCNKRNA